jgi:serine O-acetyltransferase
VTIGQTNRGKNKGTPTIGNKVWIGTNAVIVGNIRIGDNVMIAPNAFVNISVPSNSLVIGNPASILHREDATDGYIDHIHKYQPAKFHTS